MTNKTGRFAEWKQRRAFEAAEFKRKYSRYYMVYIALVGTGFLSGITGLLLPFTQNTEGAQAIVSTIAGLYFAIGFLTNGEIAANYWFGKLTDHDPDNNKQIYIAVASLALSVTVSLVTALASSLLIAYWLNIFPAFSGVPDWAQVWIVDVIPIMWVYNAVAGIAFKALSDEAQMDRMSKAYIREKENELKELKEEAKVKWWQDNAVGLYEEQGRREAEEEVKRRFNSRVVSYAKDTEKPNLP